MSRACPLNLHTSRLNLVRSRIPLPPSLYQVEAALYYVLRSTSNAISPAGRRLSSFGDFVSEINIRSSRDPKTTFKISAISAAGRNVLFVCCLPINLPGTPTGGLCCSLLCSRSNGRGNDHNKLRNHDCFDAENLLPLAKPTCKHKK